MVSKSSPEVSSEEKIFTRGLMIAQKACNKYYYYFQKSFPKYKGPKRSAE